MPVASIHVPPDDNGFVCHLYAKVGVPDHVPVVAPHPTPTAGAPQTVGSTEFTGIPGGPAA